MVVVVVAAHVAAARARFVVVARDAAVGAFVGGRLVAAVGVVVPKGLV